jgi:hypothetical protein
VCVCVCFRGGGVDGVIPQAGTQDMLASLSTKLGETKRAEGHLRDALRVRLVKYGAIADELNDIPPDPYASSAPPPPHLRSSGAPAATTSQSALSAVVRTHPRPPAAPPGGPGRKHHLRDGMHACETTPDHVHGCVTLPSSPCPSTRCLRARGVHLHWFVPSVERNQMAGRRAVEILLSGKPNGPTAPLTSEGPLSF